MRYSLRTLLSLVAVLSVVGAVYRLYPTREVHSCIRVMPVIDMHGPSWKNRQRHEALCRSLGDKILTAEFLNVTLSSFVKDPVGSRSYGTITAARLQRDLQIECLDESQFIVISIRRGSAIPRATTFCNCTMLSVRYPNTLIRMLASCARSCFAMPVREIHRTVRKHGLRHTWHL